MSEMKTQEAIESYLIKGFLKVYSTRFLNTKSYVKLSEISEFLSCDYDDAGIGERIKSHIFTKANGEFYYQSELSIEELLYLMEEGVTK